jgi:hypothetical protein
LLLNAFVRHHAPAIAFTYSCFDRLLLHGYIRALQFGGSIVSFLRHHRPAKLVSPGYLCGISQNYHRWVEEQARPAGLDLVTPPPDVRRHDWVEPYYHRLGAQPGVAVILKCRERARVATCYPSRGFHIEPAWRYVNLYYFYLQDAELGRLWLRLCPYFPFDTQVCLNGHEWLASQLRRQGIAFGKDDNAFLACDDPARLQALADAFGPAQIVAAVEPWLVRWLPDVSAAERAAGYRHRLFVAQAEYCHNILFHREAALDRLFSRLLDHNRAIGSPERLAVIFGRPNFRADTRTAQTEVKVTRLKTTVLRTGFGGTTLKQYVKGKVLLRTETACFQLRDLSVPKDVQHLPKLRQVLGTSNARYLDAQQDVLASSVDRGQLERLRPPTVSAAGRRTPGLRLDDARLLAVLPALTCFAYLIGKACFRTADLLGDVRRALDQPGYRLSQLRYDLGKLRGKGLVARLPGTQRYQLAAEGYRLAVLYQKVYHRLYAPLTAATLEPVATDNLIPGARKAKLDRLYEAVDEALRRLSAGVGLVA